MRQLELDFLIVGGGIVGLWLLKDLHKAGYSACLLEHREVGGAQTCHSHVYIHQGYMYTEVALAKKLDFANSRWQEWLAEREVRYAAGPSYFGFPNEVDAERKRDFWNSPGLNLQHRLVPVPSCLAGGAVRIVFTSPERCLEGQWLMAELLKPLEFLVSKIDRIESIRLRAPGEVYGNRVEEVIATVPGKGRVSFLPRALVLAAGAGNQGLLQMMSAGTGDLLGAVDGAQQIRKAHMLVIRGRKGSFEPITGVFPDVGGLFIVSRESEEEVVWLVSDNNSPPMWYPYQWVGYDTRRWLPRVISALEALAPMYFSEAYRSSFKWGIYEAPKAEARSSGTLPSEVRISQFGIRNLWVIWPSKLTLAPVASQELMISIREPNLQLSEGMKWSNQTETWSRIRVPVSVASERWQFTPALSWDEFCRAYC